MRILESKQVKLYDYIYILKRDESNTAFVFEREGMLKPFGAGYLQGSR